MRRDRARLAPWWLAPAALGAAFLALLYLERRRPLRAWRDVSRERRIARNVAVGAVTAMAALPLELKVANAVAQFGERRGLGVIPRLPLPRPVRLALTLLLLDYTLYIWHILLHRVPLLWRCHAAHHADLDLDVSTSARFHFAELVLSLPWRIAQILLLGVSRNTLSLWGALTILEVMFHHSNVRLPPRFEARLRWLIVTPRLHGIHHSTLQQHQRSNFSSGLTIWDLVHRTARFDVPQHAITIGLPEYGSVDRVTLVRTLAIPFDPRT
jgi:sterol desaturase/sphingolipid hydroxylase (fatty acid hydroxylase superfamily)